LRKKLRRLLRKLSLREERKVKLKELPPRRMSKENQKLKRR
jgi:hypothetical protein